MAIIGITGSIASGKTALLDYISKQGKIVFSCDNYVKELYRDPSIVKDIEENFPELQKLDKLSLAKIIYSDHKKRKKLESILHPLVAKGLEEFLAASFSQKHGAIFLEIPLLFEAGFEKYCDYIITLCCPTEKRLLRALERGLTEEMFESIDGAQMPEKLKIQRSNFVINTNVEWEEEISEFTKIIESLK
jgi:dephospho-CoA kinase